MFIHSKFEDYFELDKNLHLERIFCINYTRFYGNRRQNLTKNVEKK